MHIYQYWLAMWHTSMVLLRKEVLVWFGADQGSAGMLSLPILSHFQPVFKHIFTLLSNEMYVIVLIYN